MLFFAVDGLEWDVLLPLVQRGEMPAFAGLMRAGVFGELASLRPTSSPVIWTTIATGKRPEQHGIVDFVYAVEVDGALEPRVFNSGHRCTKAFWNILSDLGRTVDVVGWWITYPAEPIEGLMVSQTNTTAALVERAGGAIFKGTLQAGVARQVWPEAREAEVLATLARVDATLDARLAEHYGTPPHALGPLERELWDESRWAFRADETYLEVVDARLDRPPADVTAVYVGGPDVVGHRFWRYAYPEQFVSPPAAEQVENFGGLLDDAYRRVDRALAAMLAELPPETTVFVVSDHGMVAHNTDAPFAPDAQRDDRLSGYHSDAPPGVLLAAGPGIAARASDAPSLESLARGDLPRLGGVLDVLPTLLALLELPLGEDMPGAPMVLVLDADWLAAHPTTSVATHDDDAWREAHARLRAESIDLDERLEQLRALGYIR
ncbi:MAG TPA: alkaline phosphatase family protein [Planctomycetota bacterium]|nr:alkaline phosphatase family protein [Planctomycetota bacterium]